MLVITTKSETPDFKQRLEIQEYRECDLGVIIIVIVGMSWFLIVFEAHGRGSDTVRQNCTHYHHTKLR